MYMNDYKLRAFLDFLESKGYIILDTALRESVEHEKVIWEFNEWKGCAPIGSNPCSEIILDDKQSYRQEQADLRAAGWNAYNSDMVDEFPTW